MNKRATTLSQSRFSAESTPLATAKITLTYPSIPYINPDDPNACDEECPDDKTLANPDDPNACDDGNFDDETLAIPYLGY